MKEVETVPEPSVPKLQNTCGKHQDTVDACGFFRRSLFAFVVLTNTNDFSLETLAGQTDKGKIKFELLDERKEGEVLVRHIVVGRPDNVERKHEEARLHYTRLAGCKNLGMLQDVWDDTPRVVGELATYKEPMTCLVLWSDRSDHSTIDAVSNALEDAHFEWVGRDQRIAVPKGMATMYKAA